MTLSSFEQAFSDTERAAADMARAAMALTRAAKNLEKASQEGDISKIHKAVDGIRSAEQVARQEARNAESAWTPTAEEVEKYLRDDYEAELVSVAAQSGMRIIRQDQHLVAYPSLLRVLPEARAVQIDRARVAALRPSKLVKLLLANSSKKPRFKPAQFLESLYNAYKLHVRTGTVQGATLVDLYQTLTLLPGAAKDYDRSAFARDLYFLQSSGVITTKSGAKVSFSASTGTKGTSKFFTFMSPDGSPVVYFAIAFAGGE